MLFKPLVVAVSIFGLCTLPGWSQPSATAKDQESAEFFEMRVRPVLAQNCYACHTSTGMGGLQLDSREHLLKGGNSGPAIVPGKPDDSILIQAVKRTHSRLKMPPSGPLKQEESAALATWVKNGAVWPESSGTAAAVQPLKYVITPEQRAFWSFQPIRNPGTPTVNNTTWPKTSIDKFILSKLESKGLRPVRPADKGTLIRRATFDLIGLPPTPEELSAFLADSSPDAFTRVVDRLLASPQYGERWGRHWLDVARYSDGKLLDASEEDGPFPNAYRYRDWVIQALNEDMPYDVFVKAQLAADLLPVKEREKLLPALGFLALAPTEIIGISIDDRVDVLGRSLLGLTVACAQCHNHKYDPIPTRDYYSLLGVFKSSPYGELPLVPQSEFSTYKKINARIFDSQADIDDYIEKQATQLSDILFSSTSRYMIAAWSVLTGQQTDISALAERQKLDGETLRRWVNYLKDPNKDHPYLKNWYELMARKAPLNEIRSFAEEFQTLVLSVNAEKRAIDDRNYVALGGAKGLKSSKARLETNLEFLDAEKGHLWSDLASSPYANIGDGIEYPAGVYYYGSKRLRRDRGQTLTPEQQIDRFLYGEWRQHLDTMRTELVALKKTLPPPYPFLHLVEEAKKPQNLRVAIRGDVENLGEEAPRQFLQILCDGECKPFSQGSGRLELAEMVATPKNPLTARVMVNRMWEWHFGRGIVGTTSNFGNIGEKPINPELLDYLATRLIENKWSLKALNREIMLSATYALSTERSSENDERDPENLFQWRTNFVRRLEVESLRDSMLAVAGILDPKMGGSPVPLTDENNKRRTIYGLISRTKTDATMSLFDFPNPNLPAEGRAVTVGPLQRLYFMNNSFVMQRAKELAARLDREAKGDEAKISRAYRLLFARQPSKDELGLGLDFLKKDSHTWQHYAHVLLSSSEFSSVN
jgi:mono/diheme cytochrome c family protein